jgi:hypothetical protein
VHFFSKKCLTLEPELVINYTSSTNENEPVTVKEENKMMEFLMTMAIIALVFVAATVLVALFAGGLLRLKNGIFRREAKETVHE